MRRQLLVTDDGVVDAVVGYRTWVAQIDEGTVSLASITRREVEWPRGGVLRSMCVCGIRLDHSRTEDGQDRFRTRLDHSCGIYAWSHHVTALPLTNYYNDRSPFHYIVGEVLLWGTVHRHERGYRAQFAKPSAFYVIEQMRQQQRMLVDLAALQWGVPVVLVSNTTPLAEKTT